MDYLKIYNDLCRSRKDIYVERSKFKKSGNYFEMHHIKPRCMNGNDNLENLVLLTAREHFIVHYLLYRLARTNLTIPKCIRNKLLTSLISFRGRDVKINSKTFNRIREEYANSLKGRKLSEETKRKLSGRKHSEETRKKLSIISCNMSEDTKRKISESRKGKIHSEETRKKLRIPCSEEKKLKISRSNIGKVRQFSIETRRKISISNTGKHLLEETKKKMSEKLKGKSKNIWLYSLDNSNFYNVKDFRNNFNIFIRSDSQSWRNNQIVSNGIKVFRKMK